jgi:gliding-associated putative ABC transporter substrate-binding component GldG
MNNTRRNLILNSWVQLVLVIAIVFFGNLWASKNFLRLDITEDRIYSLDLTTRAMVWKLDKPLYAKVYFSKELQAPYNNHEAALMDKLEELRAYSQGWMQIEQVDPTNIKELEEEAKRFGINSIEYRFRDRNKAELKKVYMGLALVYGERQETLPAISQVETLEYDLARALRMLLSEKPEKKTIGYTKGHDEPDLLTAGGPLASLRKRLQESYKLVPVELGGSGKIDEEIDVIWVIGPQKTLSQRSLYQLDQFLMRGGSLAIFVTNTKANMQRLQPQNLYHGLETLVGHYGVTINRDIVIDRVQNGRMTFPVRQGNFVQRIQINYPLIPNLTEINDVVPAMKSIDSMLAPFSSTVDMSDDLPPLVEGQVWASSSIRSGKLKGLSTIDPKAFQIVSPGEQTGSWSVIVGLTGSWPSYFKDGNIPLPVDGSPIDPYERGELLREGAPARLVVGGSADFVANNVTFMLNLADWMVQDEQLINIRSKVIRYSTFESLERDELWRWKLFNLMFGTILFLLIGGVRWGIRRRSAGYMETQ